MPSYKLAGTINPPCQPLACIQDDFPWELGEGYATGNYRTYAS